MAGVTLEARALTKRFGERVALRDVSFQLAAGEVLAVIGANGAVLRTRAGPRSSLVSAI